MPLVPTAARIPVTGILSFGYRRSATHVHRGIDLVAPEGTPVYAAMGGHVEHASAVWVPGFTNYGAHVVLAHAGGIRTLYAHLQTVLVKPGALVARGQQIGTVGRTQFAAPEHTSLLKGAHLHFEVSPRPYPQDSEATRLDPVAWLRGFSWFAFLAVGALVGLTTWYVHKRTVLR